MLSNEKMAIAMSAVQDQLLAVIASHEREDHEGKACMPNRASAIAYLAHCLGVRGIHWDGAGQFLEEYDHSCKDPSHQHRKRRDGNFPP